jgi:hypothetical protein
MGTRFWEAVCDEHDISESGEFFGDNDAYLGRINVLYHEALGGKFVPREVLFGLEPGVIGALTLNRRSESLQSGQPHEPYARVNIGPKSTIKKS